MSKAIPEYAKAKAERVYIEQFRKSKKAILMKEGFEKGLNGVKAEQYAYAHDEYVQLLEGLKVAVEFESKCWWSLEKLKIEFEHWRTTQANERWQKDKI
jgi:hypothetical protein